MNNIIFKKITISINLLCWVSLAWAVDFIADDKPNPNIIKYYVLSKQDTIGGYPIYAGENDWKYYHTNLTAATCKSMENPQPWVYFERYSGGKWAGNYYNSVTLRSSPFCGSWTGNPCALASILKIDIPKIGNDRCATSSIETLKVSGEPTQVLRINFTETNPQGRLYISGFNIAYKNLDLSYNTVTDKDSDFNKRLTLWMKKYLDAIVKAANFDKPKDAFLNIEPLFENVVEGKVIAQIETINQLPKVNGSQASRLQNLKDIFEKKLITEEEYERKKQEILQAL